jgi:hypothetical protein
VSWTSGSPLPLGASDIDFVGDLNGIVDLFSEFARSSFDL